LSLLKTYIPAEMLGIDYRVIALDLRNAKGGQTEGPLEIERTWDGFVDDQLGPRSPCR